MDRHEWSAKQTIDPEREAHWAVDKDWTYTDCGLGGELYKTGAGTEQMRAEILSLAAEVEQWKTERGRLAAELAETSTERDRLAEENAQKHQQIEMLKTQHADLIAWRDRLAAENAALKELAERRSPPAEIVADQRWEAVRGGGTTCPDGDYHWPENWPGTTEPACIRCNALLRTPPKKKE